MQSPANDARRAFLIIGIIFVAFNLRPAITSVGPLIPFIRNDLGISNGVAGFITTLPLLSFAALSPLAPKIGKRISNERTIFLGLILLAVGIGIRSIGLIETLLLGTFLIGLGVAICNVLLPSIVKERYPTKVGVVTSVYSTSMGIFAASASGVSVPLAQTFGLGWQTSLAIWAALAFIALLLWSPQLGKQNKIGQIRQTVQKRQSLLRSTLAWQVTLFMGLQSFLFYCTIAWLPDILHSQGITVAAAGWLLAIMQFAGLPSTFITPMLADKLSNQKGIVVTVSFLYIIGLVGLFISSNLMFAVLSVIFIGFAQGSSISLSLAFLSLRAADASEAASLSGMAQSFGYLLAAVGPIFIGFLFDKTLSWTASMMTLVIVAVAMCGAGIGAGRNEFVSVPSKGESS
ncbi:MFS transporter [Pueribacillus theae]|uniref:MFS transporter n=1 Tax=Pueribacillus theae TaxID=2171751 RepID=A0A2U1JZJ1_9BACI|nr:MFS transporter [Pueribacillus theae]PWA10660.1 MFS transporter [Pueribacillus theae]